MYNESTICKCVEKCDFKDAWVAADCPTHYPSEMVLNRNYMPSKKDWALYNFTRTQYCLNR